MIIDGAIVHEADYPHPPERVWRALVDSAELGAWLMPNDFVAEVGHRFTLETGHPLGKIAGEVLHVEAPWLLRCRWSGYIGDTVVELRLTPVGAGTRLRVEHRGWDERHVPDRGRFDPGWLRRLIVDLPTLLTTPGGTMRQTRLSTESAEYLAAREELRYAEIALMRQREGVAELRRRLPEGPVVEDYTFLEGPGDLDGGDGPVRGVRLSDLFTGPDRALIVYQFMYGKRQTEPCPMCTCLIDALNGQAHHIAQNADLAIVAAAQLPALRAHARNRGWYGLRLVSAGDSTFKYDFGSEDEAGDQHSTISVFTRDASGAVRHHYTAHPNLAEDIHERGLDLFMPVWHVLDLTPQGRGDWYAELSYPVAARA
jgi:predicted dithiol-disulfide oxidoreductase (DUF899 family)/uncharacterized protein YndB with AHSA1/START domain